MTDPTRRSFLRTASLGLATAGPLGALTLRADAQPTPAVGDPAVYDRAFPDDDDFKPTMAHQEGPFFKSGAPYRGKTTPPLEPGTVMVISGHVIGFDTKKPLPGAVLDLWHANIHGRYDNDDGSYRNRVRVITDENGYYEFEAIHPAFYGNRTPHIHFKTRARGYKPLTSEMYFQGDPRQDTDPLFHADLMIALEEQMRDGETFEVGVFDVVLRAE